MEKHPLSCLECAEATALERTQTLAAEFRGREASLPRERLERHGAGSLSDAELVAILLRTGTRNRNVLSVAREMLRLCGDDLALLASSSATDLKRIAGIGRVRALEFEAVFELCRRILRASSRDNRPSLSTPENVVRYIWPVVALRATEGFFVMPLDKKMRLCAAVRRTEICVTTGTADATAVHPRDVFREAVKADACYVVVAHNHPSGDPSPSPQDAILTRRLAEAGRALSIPLADSIVVGGLVSGASADPFDPNSALPRFASLRQIRPELF